MKAVFEKYMLFFFLFCFSFFGFSQNNALVLNGGFMVMNGGTNVTPIYLVVNQTSTSGILRNSGHIVSEGQYNFVQWECATGTGNYVYPFGIGATAADYIPFTFNKTTAGSSSVDVSTWATNPQNIPHPAISNVGAVCCMKGNGDSLTSAIDRFWDIRASATADLTFSYKGAENTTSVPTDPFKAQHWNGTSWDPPVGAGQAGVTTGIGTVGPVTGQNTFSPWVLTRGTAILPVELIRFSAECNRDKDVEVKWTTATELNNDFFTIERSGDAVNFLPIGNVKGVGNSSVLQDYIFTDTDPLSATSYYRIKQTDFNGFSSTFPSASISSCGNGGLNVVVSQNPTLDGAMWVSITGAENKNVCITVTSILGQNLYTKYLTGVSGSYLLKDNLHLAAGMYVVNASTGDESFSGKIVVLR